MWQKIETALLDPRISSGDMPILVCDANIKDGYHQVVYWDVDAPKTNLGIWGWATENSELRYHSEAFTHWMELPTPPKEL